MDFSDLKNKNVKDLQTLLAGKREELRELRFKVSEKQLKNVVEIGEVKKTIARILTLLNSKSKINDKKETE